MGVQAVRTCAIGRDRERWTFKGKERESSGKEGGKNNGGHITSQRGFWMRFGAHNDWVDWSLLLLTHAARHAKLSADE